MSKHVFTTFHTPATDEQIAAIAPSVFTLAPHDSRSERYAMITTADILRGLRGEGWEVFGAGQSKAKEERAAHTKHMLRLRHMGDRAQAMVTKASAPEIVLVNSHDGSSAYRMLGGMIRFACLNGIIAADCSVGELRLPHSGKAVERVTAGAFQILDGLTRVIEDSEAMGQVMLDREERAAFARAASRVVWADGEAPVVSSDLLNPRRLADLGSDLWTTFNVVQENLMRGGLQGYASTGRRLRTRGVASIDKNVGLNRALWTLADEMKKIKDGVSVGEVRELLAA